MKELTDILAKFHSNELTIIEAEEQIMALFDISHPVPNWAAGMKLENGTCSVKCDAADWYNNTCKYKKDGSCKYGVYKIWKHN